jgi:hypothetical protein
MRGSDSHGAKIHSHKALLCRAFAHPIGFLRKKRDLVSCLITNGVFVAIKMARRSGGCRTRVPARREAVLEANGVFSFLLIRQGRGLRDRRIARTRSLPSPVGSRHQRSDGDCALSLRTLFASRNGHVGHTVSLMDPAAAGPLPESRLRLLLG